MYHKPADLLKSFKNLNSTLKCGMELEFYTNTENGEHAVDKVRDIMTKKNIKGFVVERDASLRSGSSWSGAEIIFASPTMLKSAVAKIQQMTEVVAHAKAFYMETEGVFSGPSYYNKLLPPSDGAYNGSTGLHIHFSAPKTNFNALDYLRLMLLHRDNYLEITKRAWRANSDRWAGSAKAHIASIMECIQDNQYNIDIDQCGKFKGLNLCNVKNQTGKKTVEFRYGSASLVLNQYVLTKYVSYMKQLWDLAFTNKPELHFEGYDLKIEDGSKDMVKIYRNGTYQKTVQFYGM